MPLKGWKTTYESCRIFRRVTGKVCITCQAGFCSCYVAYPTANCEKMKGETKLKLQMCCAVAV